MERNDSEIAEKTKIEALAWQLISRFLLTLKEPGSDLVIADLHPGGGTYDCLSLISTSPKPQPIVLLNRNGTSAKVKGGIVHGIWKLADEDGVTKAAEFILREVGVETTSVVNSRRSLQSRISRGIARWIQQNTERAAKAVCAWHDDTCYVGPNNSLLNGLRIPESWRNLKAPYPGSDWSAWIYVLMTKEGISAAINFFNGETIKPDGTPWDDWKALLPAAAIAVKKKGVKPLSLPEQQPNLEGLTLFREVANFDGYKVFGKDLSAVAEDLANKWSSGTPLPKDLNQLQGALFFESRRAHFSDGYPDEADLPYLKELVRLIQDLKSQQDQ